MINEFQIEIKIKMHFQSWKRFHGLIFGLFIIAILQSVLLSLWDGLYIPKEVAFLPAPLSLALILLMYIVEMISYSRAKKSLKAELMQNKLNPEYSP